MGITLCCPSRGEDLEGNVPLKPSITVTPNDIVSPAQDEKSFAKPTAKMATRLTNSRISHQNRSRVSNRSQMNNTNNTVYYSFDGSMDGGSGTGRSTMGTGGEGELITTNNILQQITEDSESASNSSHIQGSGPVFEDSEEAKENSYLGRRTGSLMGQKKLFKTIDEEVEDQEDESFYDADRSMRGDVKSVYVEREHLNGKMREENNGEMLLDQVAAQEIQERQERRITNSYHLGLMAQAEAWIEMVENMHKTGVEGYDKVFEEKKNSHKLKVFMNQYENKEGNKINRTRSEFVIPFRAEQYMKFMADSVEQKELDKNIDVYKAVDSFGKSEESSYTIYYLAYKKVLTASSRDFVYIKYEKKVNENTWHDVSKSIPHKDYPEYKDKTRGDIILGGNIITEFKDAVTGKICSKVQIYSENNFKINIPGFLAKKFAGDEMKKFVENTIQRLGKLYP